MSEQATAEQVQVSAEQPTIEVKNISPFSKEAWNETPVEVKSEETKPEQPVIEKKKDEVDTQNSTNEEILEIPEWLKREFGVDNVTVLKTEREEYKKLKEQVPQEIKFENEISKQLHDLLKEGKTKEVTKVLKQHEQIEELSELQVDKDNAAEIIKLELKLKNSQLTQKEVDFQYRENFELPKEPVQKVNEDDDDFKERQDEWKEKCEIIETKRVIAAKLAQPELLKLKAEIKFPELAKPEVQANELTPELEKQIRDNFLNKLESDFLKTDGFSTLVKDESVEIPISFKIPDEQKMAIKGKLEEGLDVSEYMNARWFGEKGIPKIEQIISDLYQLENLDKILSGVANDSANKRVLELRKQATNSNVNTQTNQNTFQPNADGKSNISPFAKEAWSERPPAQLT